MAFTATLSNGKTTNKTLSVESGFVYKEEYNETLDSATIKVKTKGEALDVEPMDFVQIAGDVNGYSVATKRLLVNDFVEDQVSFTGREDREYTINLFSQTKELEKITLPNVSITSLADGTTRSVLSYITEFVNRYAPKIKVVDILSQDFVFRYENAWSISQQVQTRFAGVVCPEFSWNKPTLAEVLTDLMLVDDCLPCIKNNELRMIDLRARGSEIDHSKIIRATKQMSSQDYNQNLTIGMQNAIGSRPAKMVEYISFRNESDGILTTQNLQVVTQKPIYNITKLVLLFRDKFYNSETSQTEFRMTEIDMTESVKESNAYDVLDPTPLSLDENQFQQKLATHQICNVFYKRGGRVIDGWSKEWVLYGATQTSVYYLTDHWLKVQQGHFFDNHTLDDFDWRDVMFRVEYESMGEVNLNAGRKLPLRNPYGHVFDGQGSSYVDVDQQSIFEYAKANRLGNKIIELRGVYDRESLVPECGQTYKGAVIFSREIQYYDNIIHFHGYATENYVLLNYYVSVRAKKRSWAIASGNEALTRHENIKYYAEFSFKRKTDRIPTSMLEFESADFAKELLSPLYHFYNDESIKLCAFRSRDSSNNKYPPETGDDPAYFIADCSAEKAGMSMAFVFQFADNYSAGITVSVSDNRYIDHIQPYCDKYGEFANFKLVFISDYDPADGEFLWGDSYVDLAGTLHVGGYVVLQDGNASWARRVSKGREKPVSKSIRTSLCAFSIGETLHKDNREVLACTVQFEFCSDNEYTVITEKFVEKQKYLIARQDDISQLSVVGSTNVYTSSTLPTASAKYAHVGLFARGSDDAIMLANAIQSDGNWVWNYTTLQNTFTKVAVLEGAVEANWTTAYVGRRVRIATFDKTNATFSYSDNNYVTFICKENITPGMKTVPGELGVDKIEYIGRGVDITGYDTSAKIFLWDSLSAEMLSRGFKAWGISDFFGNILFAVNTDGTYSDINEKKTLWLNLLRTRDCKVYESVVYRYDVAQTTI